MSATPTAPTPPHREQGADAALHGALMCTTRPTPPGALAAAGTFAWRAMIKIKHVPEQLLDVTITPVLFLLMFTYLFGGAVAGSTTEYLQFLLPGIVVQSILFTSVYAGVTLNTDATKGAVDRFRSLPIARWAPLLGAALGDCVRYALAGIVATLVGLLMGFDPDGGVLGVAAALGLIVVFAFGLAWVFTTVGLIMRSPNAVMNSGFMGLFPLIFLSNIFVPPTTLPGWLEAFVEVNPISQLVTAARGLMAGDAVGGEIALALGTAALLTAIFLPLTTRLYRHA